MHQPADVIALVQTATNLPIMLLALPAGAWADMFDKRTIMLLAQTGMFAMSLLLVALAFAGDDPAGGDHRLTALLAAGSACFNPALSASIGGIVPRAELAAAVALNILAFNVARSLGPRSAERSSRSAARRARSSPMRELPDGDRGAVALAARAGSAEGAARAARGDRRGFRFASARSQVRTIMLRAFTFTTTGAGRLGADAAGRERDARQGLGGLRAAARRARRRRGARRGDQHLVPRALLGRGDHSQRAGIVYGPRLPRRGVETRAAGDARAAGLPGAGWVQALSGFSVAGQLWSPREIVGRITAMVAA
jgi:hypothetical protein